MARQLLEKLEPEARQMPVYIDRYGRFSLVLSGPWEGGDAGK